MSELKQIGVRDKAKIVGGYGVCGRELCCSSYMKDFHPISIKMAKDQGLPLNSQKDFRRLRQGQVLHGL